MDKPKLRPVDIIPIKADTGEHLLLLRDQFHLSNKVLLLPADQYILIILSLMDGKRTFRDIQTEFVNQTKEIVFTNVIEELANKLSEAYLLEDDNFKDFMRKQIEEFYVSPIRKSTHSGVSYPDKPDEIIRKFDDLFELPDGPGQINENTDSKFLRGLIAPHIDFSRGGNCFAYCYKEIAESEPVDIYVILGIAHHGGNEKFIGIRKDFETPLGIAETDVDFVNKLAQNYSGDFFADEFLHKTEHSIEFQVVFLQYLFNGKRRFKIVPILCSSFHDAVINNISPIEIPAVASFIGAIKKTINESGKKVCIISASDLAHVGARFDDKIKMTDEFLDWLESEDLSMINHILNMDAEEFFRFIQKDQDRRKVCGFPSIYTTLQILGKDGKGKLLKYQKAVDWQTQSCVTFAGIAYY